MPTIVYTPAEQAQLNAVNKAVIDAQAALKSYQDAVASEYDSMATAFASVNGSCYKSKPSSFQSQVSIGSMNLGSCCNATFHTQSTVNACKKGVGDYNYYWNNWKTYQANVADAQNKLNAAIATQKAVTATINSGADITSQVQSNLASIGITRNKYVLFGIISLVIVVAALFVGKMLIGRKSS